MNRMGSIFGRRKVRFLVVILVLITVLVAVVPTASAEETKASTGFYYTVQWGDNLYRISVRYGTTVYAIAHANNIVNPNYIYAGQVLWIPTGYYPPQPGPGCRYYHTVTWGDTLIKLGNWYGVSPWAIAHANNIYNLNLIYRGQTLCIP